MRGMFGYSETMPITLYKRQKQIVDFIGQYIQKFGTSPTLQEIADSLGVSSLATVHEHLQSLAKKGVIRRYEGAVRGLELLDSKLGQAIDGIELPILGFIAAGSPIQPMTDPNASLKVASAMLSGKKRAFVLQVRGDSMIEEGILDGDFVVIEEKKEARDGEIVVALLDNGLATLKKFFREATRIRLEPANSSMKPIFAKNVTVQGTVVGLVRRFGQ
ncbi:MAG: LexA repressor [Microgenomates group bacterium GW2011_GWC1_46_16]|nr:MAG: LexA repressor [Microgenomates group bacterium GW2011_GWF1_46_12]KKU26173.1 MAG: LexA repressor [Microgenomates group bacterium GW2011_GWC1_46_16]KKU28177.1 MAG: LexA repressor [Microgenomates group bacterium GW2011_GWF2_46_18]KKU43738.1 MAG: LexA repressor [Microgenomates group bacterium GW2011_GWA1_46_7]KKU45606.1 MAG: LexA repressor [Microgenomates group bacterium GW2011_GWB1_46_7]KKU61551.1 MAG: LexA repressor [Microgenomates group bacterium GW2011_GWE1_47_12]KKU62264.1 MAG: LexA 